MTTFQLDPQLKSDTIEICNLGICKVLLMNESQFPWVILVPQRPNVTEIYQLSDTDLIQTQKESILISKLLMQHYQGDKLNTGALGNIVSHLHIHHIIRFKNDACWPKPVWGNYNATPYSDSELNFHKENIAKIINDNQSTFS